MGKSTMHSVVGQLMNSALMFAIIIGAAHLTTSRELGFWSLAVAVWTIGTMVNRAVVVTGALVAEADREDPLSRGRTEAGLLGSCLLGTVTSAVVVLIAIGGLRDLASELLVFSLGILVYLPYDSLRFRLAQVGKPFASSMMEICRGVLIASIMTCSSVRAAPSLMTLAVSFAWANVTLLIVAMFLIGCVPRWASFNRVIAQEWSRYAWLLLEAVLNAVGSNAPVILATVVVGAAEGGAARIAFTLAGGLGVLISAIIPVSTLGFVRAIRGGVRLWRLYAGWSLVVSVLGALYGTVLLLLPDRAGYLVGGDSWPMASLLLVPVVLELCLRGPLNGAPLSLRSALRLKSVVVLRLSSSFIIIALTFVGASEYGLLGLFWGFFAAQAIVSVLGSAMVLYSSTRTGSS